ncbi:MAG TPA: hypothetical protein PKY82_13430 [Pyrinomonadaceae bacterium]|nr:hypothetical protein [Pyrinomonadaceae bacterium]
MPSTWLTQLSADGKLLGMSQQPLFYDVIVFSLLGIGMFLDAIWLSLNI